MSIVKEIFQFDSGGIIYKDATGKILGTGTAGDSAAPDPADLEGIFIYCQSPARTLYTVANKQIKYRVKNGLTITTTPTRDQFLTILSQNFFFRVTGGGPETQNLNDVLSIGNSAGANDIDMNGQSVTNADYIYTKYLKAIPATDLEITSDTNIILNPNSSLIDCNGNDLINVNEISSTGDLFLNPVGSIDANGKTLNMTGGEIHNLNLAHGQNNTNLTIEGKGTGDIILKTNNVDRLKITDAGNLIFTFFYTVELMAALTVDFYAPFNLKISSITNLLNSPTTTIQDDSVPYILNATITAGSKITVTVNTAAVVNLTTMQV